MSAGAIGAVREAHRFDEARLDAWMQSHVEGYRGPLRVQQFRGGQSNPTYKLITPAHAYVLRRKPMGTLLKGAHAVDRESRVITALAESAVPVPRVYGLCTDDGVIGSWFYVMDHVAGRNFWDATLPDVSREARPQLYDAMNAALAALHRIDYARIGLADYGRPGNYFQRQIERWTAQYLGDGQVGRDPHMDRLIDWLPRHIPAGEEAAICHGDYRIDNLLFHPTEPRVVAVLDWELSTIGHPLGDFAYHLMSWRLPPTQLAGLAGANLTALNLPNEASYVAAYCRRTGRQGIPDLDFYVAFNMFRLAGIVHGIKGRVLRGTASSANAADLVRWLPTYAECAWAQAQRAGAC